MAPYFHAMIIYYVHVLAYQFLVICHVLGISLSNLILTFCGALERKRRHNADVMIFLLSFRNFENVAEAFAAFGFFTDIFLSNTVKMQTYDKARNAVALALSPVVKALVDPDGAMRDIRNLDSVRETFFFPLLFFFWFLWGTL